jgi:RNA polymerase sigma-70 factor, ECF subfamily
MRETAAAGATRCAGPAGVECRSVWKGSLRTIRRLVETTRVRSAKSFPHRHLWCGFRFAGPPSPHVRGLFWRMGHARRSLSGHLGTGLPAIAAPALCQPKQLTALRQGATFGLSAACLHVLFRPVAVCLQPQPMPASAPRQEIEAALRTLEATGGAPLDELVGVLYDELKEMARRHLAREAVGHTLQPTALLHEAYLKLADSPQLGERERSYFFAAAARAMRQVLVEHARRRNAVKRGSGAAPVSLDASGLGVDEFAVELLDLDRALEDLAALKPRYAQVVECRYFGGMGTEETAAVLGVSARTVKNDWSIARAWLYARLNAGATTPDAAPPADT